ncbi:MAG: hypothetical protein ACMVY4_12335 [Minwuia sp.]|uniref:winged helix domain-containing protein n=1 Tax=Minwuia sp. TaxID=2493630 RepID=UPI003A8A3278
MSARVEPAAQPERRQRPRNEPVAYIVTEDGEERIEWISEPRVVQTVDDLIESGARGVSSLECKGVRFSSYVHKLRRNHGITIETKRERHGGKFAGNHGRCILISKVRRAQGVS